MRAEYLLQRYSDNRNSTLGLLFRMGMHGGEKALTLLAYTLEDTYRPTKIKGETRIPAGVYRLRLRKEVTPLTKKYRDKYPWFKFHIEITNVPGFTGIYMHIGNGSLDTDGCVLVGDNADNNTISRGEISNSFNAYKRLYGELFEILEDESNEIFLIIRDEKALN